MTSGRQRRTQIKQRRKLKQAHASALQANAAAKARARSLRGKVIVNESLLRPAMSYSTPDFVSRGYYVDRRFNCKDCGVEETWTDTQQKWWYEIAHGDVWTTAIRCRRCRRLERARKAQARTIHQEGLARKPRGRK